MGVAGLRPGGARPRWHAGVKRAHLARARTRIRRTESHTPRRRGMTRKRRRLYFVVLGLLGLGAGTALVLAAFQDNIVFFFSPTEVAARHLSPEQRIRIGGL